MSGIFSADLLIIPTLQIEAANALLPTFKLAAARTKPVVLALRVTIGSVARMSGSFQGRMLSRCAP